MDNCLNCCFHLLIEQPARNYEDPLGSISNQLCYRYLHLYYYSIFNGDGGATNFITIITIGDFGIPIFPLVKKDSIELNCPCYFPELVIIMYLPSETACWSDSFHHCLGSLLIIMLRKKVKVSAMITIDAELLIDQIKPNCSFDVSSQGSHRIEFLPSKSCCSLDDKVGLDQVKDTSLSCSECFCECWNKSQGKIVSWSSY